MTVSQSALSYLIVVAAGALALQAAWIDLREYKIRNGLVLGLASLFVAYAFVAGQWSDLRWDLIFATVMFLALLVFYSLGWLGGGDVKFLAVAFLWVGLSGAVIFSILLAFFSSVHALAAKLGWVESELTDGARRRIPFAPSIAAAMICVLALRLLLSLA